MVIKENIVVKRSNKKPILLDYYIQVQNKPVPLVIFCHGYKGFKDWGAWSLMGNEIAEAGFCFLKFNFSHNGGTMEQPIDFPNLEAFGNNNYTKELDDLSDIIDWSIEKFKHNSHINVNEIYLLGHSRGGGISILKTAEDSRIKKLVTLASVSDFGKRSSTTGALEEWKKDGVKYVTNGRTKQEMPHYIQFYEDYIENQERLNIKAACNKIIVPHLVIHGDADTSVSIEEARKINSWNSLSKLNIIKNADHVFNVKHPWEKNHLPTQFQKLISETITFLK